MRPLDFLLSALKAAPLLLLVACSSEESRTGPGPLRATADAPPAGVAIVLRPRLEGTQLVVDVVGRELPQLSGVALRIEHPQWAVFETREVGTGWAPDTVHRVKSATPLEVALVDTAKGQTVGHPKSGEAILATLRFRVDAAPTTGDLGKLHIVPIRSAVQNDEGAVVKVSYADVSLAR
jgi:hypothetical protein